MPLLSHSSPLLLASGSPRRRELLETIGVPVVVRPVHADEARLPGEPPGPYLERVVAAKLDAGWANAESATALGGAAGAGEVGAAGAPTAASAILVADTIVVRDGEILGKPRDRHEAAAMVRSLSGRTHQVMTRFCVRTVADDRAVARTVVTRVEVRGLPEAWVERYAASDEGLDKAGAYAVQGRFAYAVKRLDGSYSNVVGLPLCEVVEALDELGLLPQGFPPP